MAKTHGFRRASVYLLGCLSVQGLAGLAEAQPFRGSDALEPGLENRDDILLFEDFEEQDWRSHWTTVPDVGFVEANTDEAFQGQRALEVTAPAGDHYGTSMEFKFSDLGLEEPEELYFRYYIWFTDSWGIPNDGTVGKLPGFGGTYDVAGWGNKPSDGYNGWSARMKNWDLGETVAVGFDPYHVDTTETSGENMPWEQELPRNQWICIEAYVKMNSIGATEGNQDGALRGWLDDAPIFERTNMRFRHVDSLKIEQVWFDVYVGGDFTAEQDMTLYFDNVVVARNRIGCFSGDAKPPPADSTGTGGSGARPGDGTSDAATDGAGGAGTPRTDTPSVSGTGGTARAKGTGGRAAQDSGGGSQVDDDVETGPATAARAGSEDGCGCAFPGRGGGAGWLSVVGLAGVLCLLRRRPDEAS